MRKTKTVVVALEGRDKGKKFLLTEMPASQAEKWATRGLLALGRAGVEIPDEMLGAGMAAIAFYGLRAIARVDFADAEPLMDEMMGCVQRVEEHLTRPLVEDDLEEVATRLWIRGEVFELHSNFSIAGAISMGSASPGTERATSAT